MRSLECLLISPASMPCRFSKST